MNKILICYVIIVLSILACGFNKAIPELLGVSGASADDFSSHLMNWGIGIGCATFFMSIAIVICHDDFLPLRRKLRLQS